MPFRLGLKRFPTQAFHHCIAKEPFTTSHLTPSTESPQLAKMGIVAIAGGTGGVGRALVEAIIARGKHEVKILSRKVLSSAHHVVSWLNHVV